MIEIIAILSISFVVYTYFGYPVLLWVWSLFKKEEKNTVVAEPHVSVIFSAHNEEKVIGETLVSILKSDYPKDKLEILVGSDGSTDRTDKIVQTFDSAQVKLIRFDDRRGKQAVLQDLANKANGDILVLIDATSVFWPESLKNLMMPFANPKVGSSVGSKVVVKTGTDVSRAEGLYWKYESWLRRLESKTGSSWIGLEGGLSAIRKELFKLDFPTEISADNALCYRVMEQGYLSRYVPQARVHEYSSQTMGQEFSRKIRVIVRQIKAMPIFAYLFNPFKYPGFFVQNVSHKIFRWLVPFLLLSLLVSSFLSTNLVFEIVLYLQGVFYALAFVGAILSHFGVNFKVTTVPFYFTTVNLAALISWFSLTRKFGVWTPTARQQPPAQLSVHKKGATRL